MINKVADEVIEQLFKSLKNRYKNNLELMKGSESVFDYVHLLYCGGLYIDSPDWIKNKKKQKQILSIKKKINTFNTL